MTQLVKLEKRFEIALEKIELALAKKNLGEALKIINSKKLGIVVITKNRFSTGNRFYLYDRHK